MSVVQIPNEWVKEPLGSLAGLITKGTTPTTLGFQYLDRGVRFIKVENIDKNGLNLGSITQFISSEANEALKRSQFEVGDVLFSIAGTIGKTALVEEMHLPCNTNQAVAIIRGTSSTIVPRLLRYQLAAAADRIFKENARGGAMNNISLADLKSSMISIPPLAEQQVIADKLDTLLAQVESIKARLERILEILKQFRQSVLAAAVSGKLTKDLERGVWKELKLEAVASNIVDCPHSTPKWSESGKYCVRTTGFNPFYLDLSQQGFVSDEVYQERIQRLEPKPNDILYSREGTVGIACQIPDGVELCLGQRMVLIRAGESCNSKYLTMVLNSDHILSIVKSMTIGSTAPRVNMKDIRNYPIPIPTMDEQNQIVLRVERLFRSIEVIGEQVQSTLDRVNNLTLSILDKAFRGELTAEWRKANPDLISGENSAEALLDRIKAECELAKPTTKRGRAKT